jgi:hypothetical protein
MKQVLTVLVLLVIACLATYVPMQWKNRDLQRQADQTRKELSTRLSDVEDSLRVAKLQNQLGLLLIDVEQNNFGRAKEASTKFFDQVRQALFAATSESARSKLESALKRRDQITADLSVMKPGLADTLRQFYQEFLGESGGQPSTSPQPAGG